MVTHGGVAGEEQTGPATTCPASALACTASGTIFFDLEAAERANPGVFRGKRIDVAVVPMGFALSGPSLTPPGDVSEVVQMLKK